ncbi:MAG: sulfite exporter TauE/SafE family protein [Alphaproteobacteria bacterium]|nr:sulfite exporter TauE/SafE family protein [Alphaproteobacteria bacterium]
MSDTLELTLLFFAAAVLYSSVGHAGASGYLAAMAIVGIAPAAMRPTALALNILVSVITTWRFFRAGHFEWRAFWPFALASVPAAFVGGALHLPTDLYKRVVGAILLLAAAQLARSAYKAAVADSRADPAAVPIAPALGFGAGIGFLSGLTGTGGGIFLSPVLLFMGWAETRRTSGLAAAFILVNSVAGLAGSAFSLSDFPNALPTWLATAAVGALIGTQLGSKVLPISALRYLLAAVLVIAGLKLLLT